MRTISEIRLTNMLALLASGPYRTLAALAEAGGCSAAYLSQVKNALLDSSGKPKTLGDKVARKLEAACGKPIGWMDRDHDENRPEPPFFERSLPPGTCNTLSQDPPPLSPRKQALLGLFDGLTETQQQELIRELEEKKQQNDALLTELLKRRAG